MTRPENDIRLSKYLRKVQRKAGQIDKVEREKRLNAVFDLLLEMDEEMQKAMMRINSLRFPVPPRILMPVLEEMDE